MNTTIKNLTEAMAYKLDELYDIEKRLKSAIQQCVEQVSSPILKEEILKYAESCEDKCLKLDRVYSYLMKEPGKGKDKVIDALVNSAKRVSKVAISDEMKDIMLISCLKNINFYKMAGYETALMFSWELELDTASTLLEEVLGWEKQTHANLSKIAVLDVNTKAAEYNNQT
ncbi:hypothetical protein GCM10009122_25770 [Fulvivirga kasyanovii]|uniref:DUF892 family protein n=1 Tax=Fulvivirga kasyanovii TaxID=396812 RepID=A0ABW9RPL8_9BACT|nr:DUF892 family protein [Fulvivirga kasyanovii]MTI24900.1 DUF892 family protein [Fulvivirga kasyanovii]